MDRSVEVRYSTKDKVFFFWTLCSMRLPTKDVLMIKQVRCDPRCSLCGLENETAVHVFANCVFAHSCWSVLNPDWVMSDMESILNWAQNMWTNLSKQEIEKVVVICWALWENRNNMLWHQQIRDPNTLVSHALLFLDSWRKAQTNVLPAHHHPRLHVTETWSAPPLAYLKVNIDVAMDFEHRCMGFGWVVRDHEGVVQGVVMKKVVGLYSVKEAEAMGAREALSWIKRKGWNKVIVESDAQVVTRAVEKGDWRTPFGAIVRDIRLLLDHLMLVTLCFVRRDSNTVSHGVAKMSLCQPTTELLEYSEFLPRFISVLMCTNNSN